MSRDAPEVSSAEALRREFDAGFALEPGRLEARIDVLAIRAGRACALRLRAVEALLLTPRITPAPSRAPELLGLAGVRGAVLPVFDLRALLGLGAAEAPRWMVVAGSPAFALAFEENEGCLRVPISAVSADAGGADELARAVVTIAGAPRALLDVDAIQRALSRRGGSREER